jgi:hypothetical protein
MPQEVKTPEEFAGMPTNKKLDYLSSLYGKSKQNCDAALRTPITPNAPLSSESENQKKHDVYEGLRVLLRFASADPDLEVRISASQLLIDVEKYSSSTSGQYEL